MIVIYLLSVIDNMSIEKIHNKQRKYVQKCNKAYCDLQLFAAKMLMQ